MHELAIAVGPELICILLVVGHFLTRGPRARRQADPARLDEQQTR